MKNMESKIMLYKQNIAVKKIVANPHTIDELIEYAKDHYGAFEISDDTENIKLKEFFLMEKRNRKITLVLDYMPELVGERVRLDIRNLNEQTVIDSFWIKLEEQMEKAASLSEEEFPIDFHVWIIEKKNAKLVIVIEKIRNFVSIEISSPFEKRLYKKLFRIKKELLVYYGVSEKDIKESTLRYNILLSVLAN